jgi:capsular exopolysaccharide synthesis family protein
VQRVEAATPPGSPASRSKFAVVVGGIVGLFLGSLLALALHLADRRLLDEHDVEDALGLPVLGRIPLSAAPDAAGGYALRDAYATVGLNVRLRAGLGESYTVLVTSGRPEEGKTSVTLGLARSLAFGGQRTLAVEADLRRPGFLAQLKLHQLKAHSEGGLKSLVEDRRSLGDAVVEFDAALNRPAIGRIGDRPRFSVIPAGIATDDPWELLASDRMEKALGDARNQFDVILVDTPALGTIGDALAFADRVDTCLLVVRLRVARKADSRRALETLRSTGVDVAGVVIIGSKRARPYGVQPPAPREVRFLAEVRRLRPAQRDTQPKQAGARPPA